MRGRASGLRVWLFLFAACVLTANAQQKPKKGFVFAVAGNPYVTHTSMGGKGTADLRSLFQLGAEEFKKQTGYTVTLKIFPASKFLYKAIQDKTVDVALLALPQYLYSINHGIPVKLYSSQGIQGKKGNKWCVYVHKSSQVKTIKHLEGKKFAIDFPLFNSKKELLPPMEGYIHWIVVKKILVKNGIHKPFREYFKEFKVLPVPYESVAYGVLLKHFDACQFMETNHVALKNYDPGFSELVPLDCLDISLSSPVVYRVGISPELLKAMRTFSAFVPKSKEVQDIRREFKGLESFPAKESHFAVYFQWLREAGQKGWIEEFNEIMKTVPKPVKK